MTLTHFDSDGNSRMVDVSRKQITERQATAVGYVALQENTIKCIRDSGIKKGDVLSVAQLAGIMGAKHTSTLIPLCHPLNLTAINVFLSIKDDHVIISATCKICDKTGVEMEALTAVSVAALTVYDMCKAIDKDIHIKDIHLVSKTGGRSGPSLQINPHP